jgi:hypothetical protein
MCGLFGFVRPAHGPCLERAASVFAALGRLAERRGRDATGFAVLGPALPLAVVKDTRPFGSLWRPGHLPMLHEARVALGHTRHATQGAGDRLGFRVERVVEGTLLVVEAGTPPAIVGEQRFVPTVRPGDERIESIWAGLGPRDAAAFRAEARHVVMATSAIGAPRSRAAAFLEDAS